MTLIIPNLILIELIFFIIILVIVTYLIVLIRGFYYLGKFQKIIYQKGPEHKKVFYFLLQAYDM